jgi:hypothetical protein
MEIESGIDIAQVVTGQFTDARQPIAQRAAVDVQRFCGFVVIAR